MDSMGVGRHGRVTLVGRRVQWVVGWWRGLSVGVLPADLILICTEVPSTGSVSTHKESTTNPGSFAIISSLFTIQGSLSASQVSRTD